MAARYRWCLVLALILVCGGLCLTAQDVKIPAAPQRWVTDEANFLSSEAAASIDARLEAFDRETGHQVIVYIGRTTGSVPIEDWAVKAFEAWKVGRKGLDDGLAVFIMADDRRMRIEVGYGLEDKVPDILAARVINDILVPGFRSGDKDAAVAAAVQRLISLITGRDEGGSPETSPGRQVRRPSAVNTIFVIIAVVFFLILLITNPSLALWLLVNIFTGGRGGGGGGGGFSGGGGRSGGGGASGSW